MEPEERKFWVLLTIFATFLGTGPFILFQSVRWGLLCTVIGLIGLFTLMPDNIRVWGKQTSRAVDRLPVRRSLLVVAIVGVSVFVGQMVHLVMGLRNSIDDYVLPRVVSDDQAARLRGFLSSHHSSVSVAVVINPGDQEAAAYGDELNNAINGGGWDSHLVYVNPWQTPNPNKAIVGTPVDPIELVMDQGVSIKAGFVGQPGPSDPKDPGPEGLLSLAFQEAKIEHGAGESSDMGRYSLSVVVSHRPLILSRPPPALVRLGNWLRKLGLRYE